MTAPGIVVSGCGNSSPDWIKVDIADEFKKISVGIGQKSFVSPLEQMPGPGSRMIDPLGETERDVLHDPGERNIIDLHDQMDMVAHQAEGMDTATKHLDGILKDQIEAITVAVVEEDRIAGVAAEDDVIESGRIMDAEFTGHAGSMPANVRKSNPTPSCKLPVAVP